MSAPYISYRRLVDNSFAAMLAAIEIYNKPQITYRDELTVILIINAWELALKAALRQGKLSVHYKKRRRAPYRSIGIDDALREVTKNALWPDSIDGKAVTTNIKALTEYRNRAIHLYNTEDLGAVIYPFLQQNVLNYRDFMAEKFNRDLADSMTWQLLPLGASSPADTVQFMKTDNNRSMVSEAKTFLEDLRNLMNEAEIAGAGMGRIAVVYDIHLKSQKKLESADFVVAVSPTADGKVVLRKSDPNVTHPHRMTELVTEVNKKHSGRKLTSYDLQAIVWKEDLRNNSRYVWQHTKGFSMVWSADAVNYLASLQDEHFDKARSEYQIHLRDNRDKGKSTPNDGKPNRRLKART